MRKQYYRSTPALLILIMLCCFQLTAQKDIHSPEISYSEEFIHQAKQLYDWDLIEKEFLNHTHSNLTESDQFFRYIFKKKLVDFYEYLDRVKAGSITESNANQYWMDQLPLFEKLYKQEKGNIIQPVQPISNQIPTRLTSCNNLDFTNKTTNWTGKWNNSGSNHYNDPSPSTLPASTLNSSASTDQKNFVHEIMTGGTDPHVPISTVPPGHTRSLRLGSDECYGLTTAVPLPFNRQIIRNTFVVSKANPTITYWYAVVFTQDKSNAHLQGSQPFFKIRVFDKDNKEIKCASYDVDISAGVLVSGFIKKDLADIPTQEAVYKDWVPILIPLINNVGEEVTIQFESSDCVVGGHVGYAYVAVDCGPYEAITTSPYICGSDVIQLTAPGASDSYKWTGPGIIQPDNKQTVSVNQPGKYTVTMTVVGNSGITCIYKLDTTIGGSSKLPVAQFSNTTVCTGNATNFQDESTPKDSISTWAWDFNNDGIIDSHVQNPSYTFPSSGTFNVKLIINQGPCDSTIIKKITVNPNPVLKITDPPAVCLPTTVDITAAAVTAGTTGAGTLSYWMDAAATQALSNPNSIGVSGTYYIKITTAGGCSDIKPVSVTLNPGAVLVITNPPAVCIPGRVDITAAFITAGSTGNGVLSYWMDPAGTIPLINPKAIGISSTYYIKSTPSTGCTDIQPVVVTILQLPVLNITNPAAVCTPSTVDLMAHAVTAGSTAGGTLSYWKDAATTILLPAPNAVAASGTYYIKIMIGNCETIKPVDVVVNPLPVSNAGPDVVICTGEAANLGTVSTPDYSYMWSPQTGLSSGIIANPTVTLTNTGKVPVISTYVVTTTNTLTGCTSTDTVKVQVNSVPTANAGSAANVCPGAKVKLIGSIGGSATSAVWSGGHGTFDDKTKLETTYLPTAAEYAAGTVTLTLTTNDPDGPCTYASSDIVLSFYKNPTVVFTADKKEGCPVHCVNFTDSSFVQGTSDYIEKWSWNFGDPESTTSNISGLPKPKHCFGKEGAYYDISLTVTSNQGCVSSLTIPRMIHVFNTPVAEFSPNPNPVSVLDPTVTLTNASSPDVVYWEYHFGDGDSVSPNIVSPVHKYPEIALQTYTATLDVKNKDGCVNHVEHLIVVGPEFTFYIPNAFTPDGDGINDHFFGKGIGIILYDFSIFDRWGNLIFHSDKLEDQWDGRAHNGEEIAQQDVYVWKVKLTDCFGKKHSYTGTVTLVK